MARFPSVPQEELDRAWQIYTDFSKTVRFKLKQSKEFRLFNELVDKKQVEIEKDHGEELNEIDNSQNQIIEDSNIDKVPEEPQNNLGLGGSIKKNKEANELEKTVTIEM